MTFLRKHQSVSSMLINLILSQNRVSSLGDLDTDWAYVRLYIHVDQSLIKLFGEILILDLKTMRLIKQNFKVIIRYLEPESSSNLLLLFYS